ncbi:uncharacterized protein LOC116262325 [Nymphaea colorata]|nr:uncharacterized protein LOC116262325 [Nymphaea colorata]
MPGITQKNAQLGNSSGVSGSRPSNGLWSKIGDDVSYDQLQKFWSELSPVSRHKLLRVEKQALFEQARKNLYCSRCNGLLLEGFSQIVMYGKSLQQENERNFNAKSSSCRNKSGYGSMRASLHCHDDAHDPLVHPWGGLVATRDGTLTLLNCFLDGASLDTLQNVFDSARAREHERELLYPDACGGGVRGWISQGMINYGRGHGTRETCALHTARLSCETLVDFWSALGDGTRNSLLRMKEEDFIERLTYRFDSKRFCRDCRRNVIREFKELKELKRMRREPRCTNWFCVADTAFHYEVSNTSIQADWHQSFSEAADTYHHFEWAVGTAEGKSDICGFQDVGMNGNVQVDGLDLSGLSGCFITLRAWRLDGRCVELAVKAHALKGRACVHRRLMVGDGFVTINKGENIQEFFEHAEDAEEEDDDDSVDRDGSEIDGDGSRPQRHAKSPELAREFLLDAATVIFKEQVEKAFREGTARQNAHSIFVCLALKLLEDRVHVACKEIIAFQKQIKLLEEEEKEKRDNEQKKERKRTKEREKKLRRKEKMRGREKEVDNNIGETEDHPSFTASTNNSLLDVEDVSSHFSDSVDSVLEKGDAAPTNCQSFDVKDSDVTSTEKKSLQVSGINDEMLNSRDDNSFLASEQLKLSRRKMKFRKEPLVDPASKSYSRQSLVTGNEIHDCESNTKIHGRRGVSSRNINGIQRQSRCQLSKPSFRSYAPKNSGHFQFSSFRTHERYETHSGSRTLHNGYRVKTNQLSIIRSCGTKLQSDSSVECGRPLYNGGNFRGDGLSSDGRELSRAKGGSGNSHTSRGVLHTKKVWEPLESRRKFAKSNSNFMVTLQDADAQKDDRNEDQMLYGMTGNKCQSSDLPKSSCDENSSDVSGISAECHSAVNSKDHHNINGLRSSSLEMCCQGNEVRIDPSHQNMKASHHTEALSCPTNFIDGMNPACDPSTIISCSDSSSSCLSEGGFSTATSCVHNGESLSTSDSEDASPSQSRESLSMYNKNSSDCCADMISSSCLPDVSTATSALVDSNPGFSAKEQTKVCYPEGNGMGVWTNQRMADMEPLQNMHTVPSQGIHFPGFPAHGVGYYQTATAWPAASTNGLMPFPQPDRFLVSQPLGFGLQTNGSSRFCMTYGAYQTLPPALNAGQLPLYPFKTSMDLREHSRPSKPVIYEANDVWLSSESNALPMVNNHFGIPFHKSHSHIGPEHFSHLQDGKVGNFTSHDERTFSLFHFGSSTERPAGFPVKPAPLKEEVIGDLRSCSQISPPIQSGVAQTKEEGKVEEYSLFAASKGSRFAFF